MLIYNYNKEFLGIDQNDLEAIGVSNLAELRKEAADFADLFVKTPGYIHNFQNVHWIDYITCKDAGVESKAIIHVNGKSYSTNLDVQTIFLIDNPSQKAFMVILSNVKPLSDAQSEKISADLLKRTAPQTATGSSELLLLSDDSDEKVSQKKPEEVKTSDEAVQHVSESIQSIEQDIAKLEESYDLDVNNSALADYVFNPVVASEELGLPIDLVEEFIQDFIAQANSFKSNLYESAAQNNFDTLKTLSHKLKGVAANLRIEDALETLNTINSCNNSSDAKLHLDILYKIIDKLSNKDYSLNSNVADVQTDAHEEEFVLSLKESVDEKTVDEFENLAEDVSVDEIDDFDVPDHIDVLELEDDEFLKQDISTAEDSFDYENLSILDDLDTIDEMTYEDTQEEALEIAMSYDKELVASEIGLDIDSFNELFNDYINESKALTASIASSIKNDDLEKCKSAAIKLKGMSENMRIHKFDDELNAIIESNNMNGFTDFIDIVESKIDEISNKENH